MSNKIKTLRNAIEPLFTISWKTFFITVAKAIGILAMIVYLWATIILLKSESYYVKDKQIQQQYNNVFNPAIFKEKIDVKVKPISEYKYFEKDVINDFDNIDDKTAVREIKKYINKYAGKPIDPIFYRENEEICYNFWQCKAPYENEFNYTSYLFKDKELLLIKHTHFFYSYPNSINDLYVTISYFYTNKGDFLFATIRNRDNTNWKTYIFDKNKNIKCMCPDNSVTAFSCIHKKQFGDLLYEAFYHQIDILMWTALVTFFSSCVFIMPLVIFYLICRFLIWVRKRKYKN